MEIEQAVKEMADVGRRIAEKGLTWGNAGNFSMMLDKEHLLITASGSRFDYLTTENFTVWEISTHTYQGKKPSKELPVHLKVYENVPWAKAVLHTSPFYTTTFSLTSLPLNNRLFVENMYYLQRVCRIPYYHPGSAELTEAVGKAAHMQNVMLLEHHGILVYDTSLLETVMAVEVMENTCRMLLLSQGAGIELKALNEETVQEFLLRSGYKAPRLWPDITGTSP